MHYELTVVQFTKMLKNLSAIIDTANAHAEEKKIDPAVLGGCRLAANQFDLIRQVQIVCDTAKKAVARLSGKTDSAPNHEDVETTLAEMQPRIQAVIDYLATFKAEDFAAAADQKISQPRWKGKWLTGTDYLMQHAIPNFYFHFTTAYSILRHNGVEVGKRAYLGQMPYQEA